MRRLVMRVASNRNFVLVQPAEFCSAPKRKHARVPRCGMVLRSLSLTKLMEVREIVAYRRSCPLRACPF